MANEAPDYLKDYLKNVSNPYQRSLIGNYFSKQREQEAVPTGEELFPEEQVAEPTEEIVEGATSDPSKKDFSFSKYFITGMPKANITGSLLSKVLPAKMAGKLGLKAGMRFIPGVGWAMAGLDAIDYLAPEGYRPYDYMGNVGKFLTWRDTEEQGEE